MRVTLLIAAGCCLVGCCLVGCGTPADQSAAEVPYDRAASGVQAATVQGALDDLFARLATAETSVSANGDSLETVAAESAATATKVAAAESAAAAASTQADAAQTLANGNAASISGHATLITALETENEALNAKVAGLEGQLGTAMDDLKALQAAVAAISESQDMANVKCPDDMFPAGVHCVEKAPRNPAGWESAVLFCEIADRHLCSAEEFLAGCGDGGPDLFKTPELVADSLSAGELLTLNNLGCEKRAVTGPLDSNPYRCCVSRAHVLHGGGAL